MPFWLATATAILVIAGVGFQLFRTFGVRAGAMGAVCLTVPVLLLTYIWGVSRGETAPGLPGSKWSEPISRDGARAHAGRSKPPRLGEFAYTSSISCRKCHAEHYDTWYATYHRTMTREATPEYVKGDFSGREMEISGLPVSFHRDGRRYYMQTVDPGLGESGESAGTHRQVFPVDRVIGSHVGQIYLSRGPQDRTDIRSSGVYLVLPYQYSLVDRQWITRIGSFLQPDPGDLFANTHVWNDVCIFCHNVKPRPRQNLERPAFYESAPAELGIACESCHGPGRRHVAVHRDPVRRLAWTNETLTDPTIVNPARLDAAAASDVCGRCHSKVRPKDDAIERLVQQSGEDPYTAGDPLTKWFNFPLPDNDFPSGAPRGNLFWRDGTPLAAGLEYQGLLLSPCFQKGRGERKMSCLSCHKLHGSEPVDQLAEGMRSNAACYECHQEKRARLTEHTHHLAGSPGSRCYNCHMPNVTYGLLGVHRSHRVVSPSASVTAERGLPNACNLCHLDQPLAWTAQKLAQWYSQDDVASTLDEDDRYVAASVVRLLRGDAVQRAVSAHAFWRAASDEIEPGGDTRHGAAALGNAPEAREQFQWAVPFLVVALDDPYAAVRLQAHRAIQALVKDRESALKEPVDKYFYLDLAGPRSAAAGAILDRWQATFAAKQQRANAQTGASGRIPRPVPLNDDGTVQSEVVDRLTSSRDERDVAIDE